MPIDPKEFGGRLEKVMVEKGMNQFRLAKRLGLSQVMISRYISGKDFPRYETLAKMTQILNISILDLTGGELPDIKLTADQIRTADIDQLLAALKEKGFPDRAVDLARLLHEKKLEDWQVEAIRAILAKTEKKGEQE